MTKTPSIRGKHANSNAETKIHAGRTSHDHAATPRSSFVCHAQDQRARI